MLLLADFALILAIVFPAGVGVFVATGLALEAINRRHPDRRIQPRLPRGGRLRDMLASLRQLAVTSACIALGIALQRAGHGVAPLAPTWWSVPLMAGLGIVLLDAWFYFVHRLLHTRALYRFHRPHHLNVAPTVWNNDAGHAVDTLMTHSFYVLLPVVLPVPVLSVVLVRLFDQITAIIGHCGHEHFAGVTMRWPWLGICTVYHDQHHSAFRYNYANFFSFWDRLFGTVHPGYDAEVARWEAHYRAAAETRAHPAE